MSGRAVRRAIALVALGAVTIGLTWMVAGAGRSAESSPDLFRPAYVVTTAHTNPVATALDPGLVAAFDQAQAAAAQRGLSLSITSGFRTPEQQQSLLDEAIEKYGSEKAALRWVFTPERSMHVQGLAIDVGDGPAADWLDAQGSAFGLCRTLQWEWWHFEWRDEWARSQTCPGPVDDPADAPRR